MEENMFRGILLQQINRNCEIEISDESLTSEQLCIINSIERLLQNHSVVDEKNPYAFMGSTMDYVLDNEEWLLNSDISLQLRARIHDIKGIRKQDSEDRKEARRLFAYVVEQDEREEEVFYSVYRYIMLCEMDSSLSQEMIVKTIRIACHKIEPIKANHLLKILTLCFEYKKLPDCEIAEMCEAHIDTDNALTESWISLAEKVNRRAYGKESDEVRRIQRLCVDYYKRMANANCNEDGPSYIRKRHFLQLAIKKLKNNKLPFDYQKEVSELKREYDAVSRKFVAAMHPFKREIDYTEEVQALERVMNPLSKEAAICFLAHSKWFRLLHKTKLREQVILSENEKYFERLFLPAKVDREGHTIYKMPMFDEHNEASVSAYMELYAGRMFERIAIVLILPCLRFIHQKRGRDKSYIKHMVSASDWIPEKRKQAWIKGIIAGYNGDFCVAASILAPQLEAWIRFIAETCGGITYSMKDDGIEQANTLEYELSSKEIMESLDEDIVFTLRVLLTSVYGCNLRNRIAHGLLDDDQYATDVVYLWWVALHICYLHADLNIYESKETQRKG